MSKECPACGYDRNPVGAEFCETCGEDLGSSTPPSPTTQTNPPITNIPFVPTPSPDSTKIPPPSPPVSTALPLPPPSPFIPTPSQIPVSQQKTSISKKCPACGYDKNISGAEFCETCGADLVSSTPPAPPQTNPPITNIPFIPTPSPDSTKIPPPDPTPQNNPLPLPDPTRISPPDPTSQNNPLPLPDPSKIPPPAPTGEVPIPTLPINSATTARLIAKLPNAPVTEFLLQESTLIGFFTPENGPVDIDLEEFPGGNLISAHHAEIIYQNGQWIVKDLSTNGTYIKPVGGTRFGARFMNPTTLNSGDEIAFAKVSFFFQTP